MSRAKFAALIAAAVAAATMLWTPATASAATGCQNGFGDPGPVTFWPSLQLPRLATGLDQGVYTVDELAEGFAIIDANGDGTICLKSVSNLRGQSGKHWAAFYLGTDNKHPVH
jgi:hypothetical protein